MTVHNEARQILLLQRTQKLNSKKLFTSFNEPPASSYKSQRERKRNVENSKRQLPALCSKRSITLIFCIPKVQGVREIFNRHFKSYNYFFILSIT